MKKQALRTASRLWKMGYMIRRICPTSVLAVLITAATLILVQCRGADHKKTQGSSRPGTKAPTSATAVAKRPPADELDSERYLSANERLNRRQQRLRQALDSTKP